MLVDDLADTGKTLIKSIKWLEHFYGFYLDEKIKLQLYGTNQLQNLNLIICRLFKRFPWIHMPFEKYETTNIKDFKFENDYLIKLSLN